MFRFSPLLFVAVAASAPVRVVDNFLSSARSLEDVTAQDFAGLFFRGGDDFDDDFDDDDDDDFDDDVSLCGVSSSSLSCASSVSSSSRAPYRTEVGSVSEHRDVMADGASNAKTAIVYVSDDPTASLVFVDDVSGEEVARVGVRGGRAVVFDNRRLRHRVEGGGFRAMFGPMTLLRNGTLVQVGTTPSIVPTPAPSGLTTVVPTSRPSTTPTSSPTRPPTSRGPTPEPTFWPTYGLLPYGRDKNEGDRERHGDARRAAAGVGILFNALFAVSLAVAFGSLLGLFSRKKSVSGARSAARFLVGLAILGQLDVVLKSKTATGAFFRRLTRQFRWTLLQWGDVSEDADDDDEEEDDEYYFYYGGSFQDGDRRLLDRTSSASLTCKTRRLADVVVTASVVVFGSVVMHVLLYSATTALVYAAAGRRADERARAVADASVLWPRTLWPFVPFLVVAVVLGAAPTMGVARCWQMGWAFLAFIVVVAVVGLYAAALLWKIAPHLPQKARFVPNEDNVVGEAPRADDATVSPGGGKGHKQEQEQEQDQGGGPSAPDGQAEKNNVEEDEEEKEAPRSPTLPLEQKDDDDEEAPKDAPQGASSSSLSSPPEGPTKAASRRSSIWSWSTARLSRTSSSSSSSRGGVVLRVATPAAVVIATSRAVSKGEPLYDVFSAGAWREVASRFLATHGAAFEDYVPSVASVAELTLVCPEILAALVVGVARRDTAAQAWLVCLLTSSLLAYVAAVRPFANFAKNAFEIASASANAFTAFFLAVAASAKDRSAERGAIGVAVVLELAALVLVVGLQSFAGAACATHASLRFVKEKKKSQRKAIISKSSSEKKETKGPTTTTTTTTKDQKNKDDDDDVFSATTPSSPKEKEKEKEETDDDQENKDDLEKAKTAPKERDEATPRPDACKSGGQSLGDDEVDAGADVALDFARADNQPMKALADDVAVEAAASNAAHLLNVGTSFADAVKAAYASDNFTWNLFAANLATLAWDEAKHVALWAFRPADDSQHTEEATVTRPGPVVSEESAVELGAVHPQEEGGDDDRESFDPVEEAAV